MTSFRLPKGGLVDRSTELAFSFDGKRFTGHQGDTLSSALLANGVTLMGRSFKYHRPRGPITAGAAEPNALVELREGGRQEANTRATMVELYDGLTAKSQNRWPSLDFDIGAVTSLASQGISMITAVFFVLEVIIWILGYLILAIPLQLLSYAILRFLGIGKGGSGIWKAVGDFSIWLFCGLYLLLFFNILFSIINFNSLFPIG